MKTYYITVGTVKESGKEKEILTMVFDKHQYSGISYEAVKVKEKEKALILDKILNELAPQFYENAELKKEKSNVIPLHIANTIDVSLLDKADIEFLLDTLMEEIEVISPEYANIVDSLVDKITVKKQVISHKDIN